MKVSAFFKDKHGKVVLWQYPNVPALLWGIFLVMSKLTSGSVQQAASIISFGALLIWAVLEIGWGVSPFRRLLGLVILVISLLGRLQA